MNLIEAAPPPEVSTAARTTSPARSSDGCDGRVLRSLLMERQQMPRGDILSEFAHATFPDGTSRGSRTWSASRHSFSALGRIRARSSSATRCAVVDQIGPAGPTAAGPGADSSDLLERSPAAGRFDQADRAARAPRYAVGDLKVPAGTKVLVALSAANHDARRWPDPQASWCSTGRRSRAVGFGRRSTFSPAHRWRASKFGSSSSGSSVTTSNIDLDESKHGSARAARTRFRAELHHSRAG